MINMYNSILRGLPIGGASPTEMTPTGVGAFPAPSVRGPSVPVQAGAPPAPFAQQPSNPGMATPGFVPPADGGVGGVWNKLMSDPDIARALLSFGATALQAREQGMGFGAGFGTAAQAGVGTFDLTREKRLALKRQLLKDNLENSKTRNEIKAQEMALEDARLEREALAEMAGGDRSMEALGRLDPKSLLKLKYPQLAAMDGSTPAAIQIANDLQKAREQAAEARSKGDIAGANKAMQRVNDLMLTGKMLNKGQMFNENNEIVNMEGFVDSAADLEGKKQDAKNISDQTYEPVTAGLKKTEELKATKLDALEASESEIAAFDKSLERFEGVLDNTSKNKMGPVKGRIASATGDAERTNLDSAMNEVTLRAKGILGMPSSNFSDADRKFLEDIAGGKFSQYGGYKRVVGRMKDMVEDQRAIISSRRSRITGQQETAPEETKAPKPESWQDVGGGFKIRRKQ